VEGSSIHRHLFVGRPRSQTPDNGNSLKEFLPMPLLDYVIRINLTWVRKDTYNGTHVGH